MFALKCPECIFQSHDFDESYRHMHNRLDWVAGYRRHYERMHAPIPLPLIVERPDKGKN